MVLISLSNLFQLVRFSEQRPQSSDEVGYYSMAQPFIDESNQYDETPVVPPEDSTDPEDDDPSDDCDKRSVQTEPSRVKGFHLQKRKASFENAQFPEDKIPIIAHDFLDRNRRSYNPNEVSQGTRGIRMSDSKKGFPRSFNKRSLKDDNAEIYKDRLESGSGLISGDENGPDKAADALNTSLPTLSIQQLDKITEINASITTPDKGAVHLPLEDVLSLLKVKRSAYDSLRPGLDDSSIASSGSGEEVLSIVSKEEIADLDVAESSIIFKPLFRYRSQIGQRRRVYNNYE